jgi:hypothetical protein
MQEQGIILETFKKAKTKIITPRKTYDLQDEWDDEYSEFEAFMSRKELKLINRRLQRGRLHSINEGNYIGTYAPYGYIKSDGTLTPHPEQAPIVSIIFALYTEQNMGTGSIANHLNSIGVKSYTNIRWSGNAVSSIIDNPVYVGKITWKKKESKKPSNPQKRREVRKRPQDEWMVVDGRHPALISQEIYDKGQIIKRSRFTTPVKLGTELVNPLAGLVMCKICGSKMCRRPYQKQIAHIICPNKCGNKSARFEYVENRVIEGLEGIFNNPYISESIEKKSPSGEIFEKSLQTAITEKEKLEVQKLRLYDLLEQNVYDVNTFLGRSKDIAIRLTAMDKTIDDLNTKILKEKEKDENSDFFEKASSVLQAYKNTENIIEKNYLMKTILEKAVYHKSKDLSGDNFELFIYLRYPSEN